MKGYICLDPPLMGVYTVERVEPSPLTDIGLNRQLYDVWVSGGYIQMGLRVLGELPRPGNTVRITGWAIEVCGFPVREKEEE